MADKKLWDLNLPEAIEALDDQLIKMRKETDRAQLKGIDVDTAFELGYEAAIFDLRHVTGPNPFEVHLRIVPIPTDQ